MEIKLTEKQFKLKEKELIEKDDGLFDIEHLYEVYQQEVGNLRPGDDPYDYFVEILGSVKEKVYIYGANYYVKISAIEKFRKKISGDLAKFELEEENRLEKKLEQERKNKEIAEKRLQYKNRNWKELGEIKKIQNKIKIYKRGIEKHKSAIAIAEAFNSVNELFRKSGTNAPRDVKVPTNEYELTMTYEIEFLEKEIKEIRKQIQKNEKLFKNKSNNN